MIVCDAEDLRASGGFTETPGWRLQRLCPSANFPYKTAKRRNSNPPRKNPCVQEGFQIPIVLHQRQSQPDINACGAWHGMHASDSFPSSFCKNVGIRSKRQCLWVDIYLVNAILSCTRMSTRARTRMRMGNEDEHERPSFWRRSC